MPAEIYQLVLKGTLGGLVQTRTIFTCEITLAGADQVQDVGHPYITSVFSPLYTYISNIFQTYSYDVYLRIGNQWNFIKEVPFVLGGSSVGEPLANLIALPFIAKAAGKRLIGRKFIPGLTEAAVNGNALVSAALIAAATACASYVATYTSPAGSTLVPGILAKDGLFKMFVSGVVSSLLGTMRRRKPGLGI